MSGSSMRRLDTRPLLSAVLALVLLTGMQPAIAQSPPDAADILQHVRDAQGKRPATQRENLTYDAFGLHGTRTTVRDGADYLETAREGPFVTAEGSFHGQAWHQNTNGETILDQPDPGLAVADPYTTTVAPITDPVAGYVISVLNKRGRGTKQYVDSNTWRVVRRDVISASGTRTFTYDDFRTTGGYTQPWHWSVTGSHPDDTADYRITALSLDPVTEADLAIPPDRRRLVEFPANASSVALPARDFHDRFVVRVNVGSRGLDLLLDTGASGIVIEDSVVRELDLPLYGERSNGANAGTFKTSRTIVPSMTIGGLTLHDVVVGTIPPIQEMGSDYRVVGLLGFDFIAAVALKLDYEAGTLTAIDPATFTPPADPMTSAIPVRLGTGQPLASVTVNGALGERFAIDTRASGALLLFDYFARRHPEAIVDKAEGKLGTQRFLGVGCAFETHRYEFDSIRLGGVTFHDFEVDAITSSSAYGGNQDGVLGTSFLHLYTLFTDYRHSELYLVPNALGRSAIGN